MNVISVIVSNAVTNHWFKHVDPEDIEDLLKKIEMSFNIRFASDELAYITTFGQLCAILHTKSGLKTLTIVLASKRFNPLVTHHLKNKMKCGI